MNEMQMTPHIDLIFHLEKAIENNEFELFFQPIIHTISGSLCGFEALVRWHHPQLGFLNPGQFIWALEDTKQIYHLDVHIVEQVCRWYARECALGRPVVPVSVNLSRIDFESIDMFRAIEKLTQTYGMPRNMLNIEITESAFGEGGLMNTTIMQFRDAGYQVWMDDFGSGYSSLNTLKDYIFDEIKIDMGFLSDMSARSKCIISSMISMAKDIRMVTLVEGVETEEQVEYLRRIGCDRMQGYYFSRPLPYQEILKVLDQKGIPFETADDRKYYHEINRINLLSPSPFSIAEIGTERQGGGIPLAILEKNGEDMSFIYQNEEFGENLKVIGASTVKDAIQKLVHFGVLSAEEINHFLSETIEKNDREMNFSINGDLCSARAKLISSSKGRYAMLLSISNITQSMNITHENLIDQSLRNIYSMYLRVSILRLEKNELVTVFSQDHLNVPVDVPLNLVDTTREYIEEGIHEDDRDAYVQFLEPRTLESRIQNSKRGFINARISTMDENGEYTNKIYLAVAMGNHEVLLLVRYANL